jgi:putative phosphoribosyl transferase
MVNQLALYIDRRDAGRRLAEALQHFRGEDVVVVALPRGGVPVGYEVAAELGAPLDIVIVRKLGAPMQPEYGIGAVGEGDIRVLREGVAELLGIEDEELETLTAREFAELERRRRLYRGDREALPVAGRTVLLVDDGVATGGTAIAAARVLRARGAERVVLAVPVGPPGTPERLGDEFDEVICLQEPEEFFGVGAFYADFAQVTDEEVLELLDEAQRTPATAVSGNPASPAEPAAGNPATAAARAVELEIAPGIRLPGDLRVPEEARGLVLFAHGSGSSRLSPRNRQVAATLNEARIATLLFDLLTDEEAADRDKVFDIGLLAERLVAATRWAQREPELRGLRIGYFGASTGAAAALLAAAELGDTVAAVVSRGGRPDLARDRLGDVVSPTLLIVGGADWVVLGLNEEAAEALRCEVKLAIVPRATHLFEEPGALERVAALASAWFSRHLAGGAPRR